MAGKPPGVNEDEWDRLTMASIACALTDDSEGLAELLRHSDPGHLPYVVVRLAAMAAHALLMDAESDTDRAEVLARWQACILDHEARRATE
jgi:hypothetical protein